MAASVSSITDSTQRVKQLVDELQVSSHEQSQGIDQISSALTELESVTQQSAASAEQSASVSVSMSEQARLMKTSCGVWLPWSVNRAVPVGSNDLPQGSARSVAKLLCSEHAPLKRLVSCGVGFFRTSAGMHDEPFCKGPFRKPASATGPMRQD